MAMTYTWKITGLQKRDQVNSEGATLAGAVVQTYWEMEGTDENGDKAKFSGATPFSAADVAAGSFVAFEELTEANVLAWVQNVVENDPTYAAHIEGRIRNEIDKSSVSDIAQTSLPWSEVEGDGVTPELPADSPAADDAAPE